MRTSRRVVEKTRPLPGNRERSERPKRCVSASLGNPESFSDSRQRVHGSAHPRREAAVTLAATCSPASLLGRSFAEAVEPAPGGLRTGKLSGFPTVYSAPSFFHSALRLRTRRKAHSVPRAREAIPCLRDALRCRCLRLARM